MRLMDCLNRCGGENAYLEDRNDDGRIEKMNIQVESWLEPVQNRGQTWVLVVLLEVMNLLILLPERAAVADSV
jgi:hypothetical protein